MNTPLYKAPPELKGKIRVALRKESKSRWIFQFRRTLFYAVTGLSVCLLAVWTWMAASHGKDRELIAQAIDSFSGSSLLNS